MVAYLVMRIEQGKLDYTAVVAKYPQYKTEIDTKLTDDGHNDLIV